MEFPILKRNLLLSTLSIYFHYLTPSLPLLKIVIYVILNLESYQFNGKSAIMLPNASRKRNAENILFLHLESDALLDGLAFKRIYAQINNIFQSSTPACV